MNESNLHQYQIKGVEHILNNPYCGLFLEMGLGKTVTTLTAINKLMYEELAVSKVLIIAPKRVVEFVWTDEIAKWDHLKHITYTKIVGLEKHRLKSLEKKTDIYLISRDNIAWLVGEFGGKLPFDMIVIDELSSFKHQGSLRFKALKQARRHAKRVVGLTGTPAPNGLIDLWAQMFLLDMGERLFKTITNYRDEYFRPDKRNGDTIFSYKTTEDSEKIIYDKISDICISMKSKDYLDLPETIYNDVIVKLPEDVQKMYDDFEEEKVLELIEEWKDKAVTYIDENGEEQIEYPNISAMNGAALCNKLLQFANGAVYDDNRNYHVVHNLKIEALKDIIEDANGSPVLVAWTYRHDMLRIMKDLKQYKPREFKTEKDKTDWNNSKIRLMLMHPASGGHGLNLQHGGNIIVWFGQNWSLELYQQFNARLDRQGQVKSVVINKIVCDKTIDIDVVNSLSRKTSDQNRLMDAVKARIKKYSNLIGNNL